MIRIGIVGCGRIMAAHLRAYRLLKEAGVDDFRITALCSLPLEEAQMYAKRGQGPPQRAAISNIPGDPLGVDDEYVSDFQDDVEVQVYDDFRKMIAEAPLDAVNDFTCLSMHHQVAEAALEKGKDLLTEKPMAVSVRAAKRMCELAEARGLVLGVFQSGRYMPRTRYLKWLFETERFGKLKMALLGNIGALWVPDQIVADTPWRHRRDEAGGVALDVGVHRFDMFRHFAGEIENVQATIATIEPERFTRDAEGNVLRSVKCDAEDTIFVGFNTEQGTVGDMLVSWAGCGGPTMLGAGDAYYGQGGLASGNEVSYADGTKVDLAELYEAECDPARKEKDCPLGLDNAFALAHYDWLNAVRNRCQPETSGREGLINLACSYAVLESAHAGQRVAITDVLSGALADAQKPINERYKIA